MRSYEAARGLFSFISFVGWAIIVIGGGIALLGAAAASESYRGYGRGTEFLPLIWMLPGVGVSVFGVIILAMSQIGRAGVDSAEYSQQMLQLSRESLEVSRQSLRQGEQMRTSFEALTVTTSRESSASYADLRSGSSPQTATPQPTPVPGLSYANRAAEPTLAPATEALALHAPAPEFGSVSLNGSSETAKSS